MNRAVPTLFVASLSLLAANAAHALIMGGEGNKPIRDPGWPKGAAVIFNHPGRIAYWVGPPFGGGNWHSECRGDAKTLSAVLADFAKIDAKIKRVVVHDGVGHSFWLAPNREPAKLANAKIDWSFSVWQPKSWDHLRQLPSDLNPTAPGEASPPTQIDVYTASLPWPDVAVPPGIEIVDHRLVSHGFTIADGVVFEGKVTDLASKQPLAATIKLQRVEPQPTGGYAYPSVTETKADADGHWVIKRVPSGWLRVVVDAAGYAPRVAGYTRLEDEPRWQSFETGLARTASIAGRVLDDAGQPLKDVKIHLGNVGPEGAGRYESPTEYSATSDAEGRFSIPSVPAGKAAVWAHKSGYVRPGLGEPVATPADNIELKMQRSGSVEIRIDFTGKKRPDGYIVSMSPEGGDKIGSYGGSGNIDAEGKMVFKDMPAGRYIVHGRPNPGSTMEETDRVTVEVKGGSPTTVTLKAK